MTTTEQKRNDISLIMMEAKCSTRSLRIMAHPLMKASSRRNPERSMTR